MPDDAPLSTQHTPWTLILLAQGPDADPVLREECLSVLFTQYRKPIGRFFRNLGFTDANDRDDLTQQLFLKFFEKNLLDRLDRDKGRFRSYLKTVARSVARDARRDKAGRHPLSAFTVAVGDNAAEQRAVDPGAVEDAFDRDWAKTTREKALAAFRLECEEEGLTHWIEIFELRTLRVRDEARRLTTAEVAAEKKMTIKQVENVVARANARFRQHIRRAVRRTVAHETDVDKEMQHLWRLLKELPE